MSLILVKESVLTDDDFFFRVLEPEWSWNKIEMAYVFPGIPARWAKRVARERGKKLREEYGISRKGSHVLLAGRKVEAAFGFHHEPFYWQMVRNSVRYYVIPHPEDRRHWFSQPDNLKRFLDFMEERRQDA